MKRNKPSDRLFGLVIAAAMLLCQASPAAAVDGKGFGTAQCARLNTVVENANVSQREQITIALHQWVFGYLSGRNAQSPETARSLESLDADATAVFVLSMCRLTPGKYVYSIVNEIYEALPYAGPSV
ncbi:MAG: hypothetical protein AAF850_06150 [Pseudomonadota bacterium]